MPTLLEMLDEVKSDLAEANHWHAYSVTIPDEDGNIIRINKVQDAIQNAQMLVDGILKMIGAENGHHKHY